MIDRQPATLIYGFLVALAHALVLGLPALILLQERVQGRLIEALLTGAVVGAVPWAAMSFLFETHSSFNAWTNGVQTINDVLQALSETHGMSLRDSSREPSDMMLTLFLSACSDTGINFEINELRFSRDSFESIMKDRGIGIAVFAVRPNAGWRAVARGLIVRLDEHWPGRVRFRDGVGQITGRPSDL